MTMERTMAVVKGTDRESTYTMRLLRRGFKCIYPLEV
jgi:hypothetical protein